MEDETNASSTTGVIDSLDEAQTLKHKYDLKEPLGRGTSSTVYRAVDRRTGDELAVKVVDLLGEHGDAYMEQVKKETLREIDILKQCAGHGNIVHLYESYQSVTNLFLVIELCKGGELFDYLTRMISLPERKVRNIMKQVLEGVKFIHELNIVHRDLKPENILLLDDMQVKISDFGFGIILEEGEKLRDLCGTPAYLAPEVLAASMYEDAPGYGVEVDMWACGVILFTMLCGSPPFWNRRQMIMLRSIMNGEYSFDNPEWNDVSTNAKNLVQQLLIVDPKERLTAEDALEHPFFHTDDVLLHRVAILSRKVISAFPRKRKELNRFRIGAYCVICALRLLNAVKTQTFDLEAFRSDPYSVRLVRKAIDTAAFSIYRHWVKKEAQQNRAALFEHVLPQVRPNPSLQTLVGLENVTE